MVHEYELTVDNTNLANFKITKEVSSGQIKNSLQSAFDLNWIDNAGVLNSLMQKLANAESAFARGQTNTIINGLKAFINEVKAQKGRHIKEEAADIVISDAQTLIEQIQKGIHLR